MLREKHKISRRRRIRRPSLFDYKAVNTLKEQKPVFQHKPYAHTYNIWIVLKHDHGPLVSRRRRGVDHTIDRS